VANDDWGAALGFGVAATGAGLAAGVLCVAVLGWEVLKGLGDDADAEGETEDAVGFGDRRDWDAAGVEAACFVAAGVTAAGFGDATVAAATVGAAVVPAAGLAGVAVAAPFVAAGALGEAGPAPAPSASTFT